LFKTALHPPYPAPSESSPHPISVLQINFNIISLLIPKEFKWTFSFRLPHQIFYVLSHIPYVPHALPTSYFFR